MAPTRARKERMGYQFIPFTFPTAAVSAGMSQGGAKDSSYSTVNKLWSAYEQGVAGGMSPVTSGTGKAAGAMVNYLFQQGFDRMTVAAFLNQALQVAPEFLAKGSDPSVLSQLGTNISDAVTGTAQGVGMVGEAGIDLGEQVIHAGADITSKALSPILDPVTKVVKYVAIGAASLAAIYVLYKISKMAKLSSRFA